MGRYARCRRCPALLALLLACTPLPEPVDLAELVLSGDLEAARAGAERRGDLPRWTQLFAQLDRLEPERAAVRQAEQAMLLEAARAALAGGDPGAAAGPLAALLEAYPDAGEAQALVAELEATAQTADAEAAATIYATLAEVHGHDPGSRDAFLKLQAERSLSARYAADRFAETRAAQAGATLQAGERLLTLVSREYVVEPDWSAMVAGGRARLEALSASDGARSRWPRVQDIGWPMGARDATAALAASVRAGATAERPEDQVPEEGRVPEEVIVAEWADGALASLDPWTRVIWPPEIAGWQDHHAGVRHAAGLELLGAPADRVQIDRPVPDTPAWTSGARQGDVILGMADDTGAITLADLPPAERLPAARAALQGPPGTTLRLAIERAGTPLDLEIARSTIPLDTLRPYARGADNQPIPWLDEDDGLAYLRILNFREHSQPDFDAYFEAHLGHIAGILLDLRGNPGGDVNAAVQLADRFVESGILAETGGRVQLETGPDIDPATGETLAPWNAAIPGHALEGTPLVILVDADTASAAEILAGALQERAGAIVIGAPTWGKGLAQGLREDEQGAFALQITNQVWTLPSGRKLSREVSGGGGIQPDLLLVAGPGERFQVDLQGRQRAALQAHADGTPLQWLDTTRRQDLPPLSADPGLVLGELVLRASIQGR